MPANRLPEPEQLRDCPLFVCLFTLGGDDCLPADSNTSHCCRHLWTRVSVDLSKQIQSQGIGEAQRSHKHVKIEIYEQ